MWLDGHKYLDKLMFLYLKIEAKWRVSSPRGFGFSVLHLWAFSR